MSGNVYEFVTDWYDPKYYEHSPSRNPTGPATGTQHCARSGSWDNMEKSVRTVKRESLKGVQRSWRNGFRTGYSPAR
jgi:sulfatase modifying factor 1